MGNTEKRRPGRHRKRRMQRHKRSVLAVSAVVLLLSANSISLKSKEEYYQGQEMELEQQIQEEKARAEEIEELREYVGTDQYVEDVAREKLGLIHENEIILKEK